MKSFSVLLASVFTLGVTPNVIAAEIAGGNGGFEANTFTNPGFANITDLWETTAGTASGWTFSGTGRWFMKNTGDNSGAPHDGTSYLNLALGEYGGYGFSASTSITGLTVGKSYAVEFFASERVGSAAGTTFSASVNTTVPTSLSVTEASLPTVTTGRASYVKQTLLFVATASSHTFTVSNAGTGSSAGFLVDDFSVAQVVMPPTPPGTLADYNETWTTPSTHSWESMPLGNGETTLNVWVEGNGDLLFFIGRSDAESENNRNIKLGRVRVKLTPNPFATGLPFNQTLDLATGRILITAGNSGSETRLQVRVDANQPVIRVTGDSDVPVTAECGYELEWRTLNSATAMADTHQGDYVLDDGTNTVTWYHRNRASAFVTNLTAEGLTQSLASAADPLMNRTFGGRISGTGMTRDGAQKLVKSNTTSLDLAIDVHAGVYPTATNWKTDLDALATARAARDPAADLTAHQSWWSAFWNRSYLHLGGQGDQARRISKYYAHQRFINACTVRGNYPTPFNGSTLTMERPAGYPGYFGTNGAARTPDDRDWDGLRIFWQNTRHIYWPLLISGDYDMTASMARVCRDILPICKERAMVRENNPGMLLYEGIGVGGDTVFGNNIPEHLNEHRGGMTDVAILLADIYDHTRDEAFFTDTYLPWTDAVVTFFDKKFPNRDANGKMLISPSAAVETYKNSTNPATEVGPLRRILIDLLRLDPGALSPTQRARYQGLLDIMPGPPLKTLLNQPMLGVYQTGDAGRSLVETPAHYTIWPSREAGLGRHSLLAAGRRDHASRMYSFDGTADRTFESGGWLYTPTMAAQLNLPQQAKFYALRNFLDPIPDTVGNGTISLPNNYPGRPRFHAFWESRFDYIPDQCHGGSTTIGLQHMVIQSHGDKIYLFPAWPEEWDLNFKVHAARNTVLEGVYQNGVLQSLTVTPSSRAADVIDMSTAANRIRGIVGTCVSDTNYLLGLPGTRDAQTAIPAATASLVTGTWFTQYGHTLDGGLAGPFIAADWGGSMAKGNSIFLHVLDWPGETLRLPALALGRQITGNAVLTGGTATVNQSADGITITLPSANHDPVVTIIRLDLDGSSEALARHQPYVDSATTGMSATATAETSGNEATKACDADQTSSWRHGAGSGTLTIPLGANRRLNRIEVQFDNSSSIAGQNISVTLDAQNPSGTWSTLWSGTSYTQILSRPLVPVDATAVRLTTNAQGVRQLDAFTEVPPYTRSDDGATGHSTIDVPVNDALFRESLTGAVDLVKTGPGTLSLIDAANHSGATRILEGTLKLHPPLSTPAPGFIRRFDASTLALSDGAAVSQWNDLSPNNSHATPQTGHPPTFLANAVNGFGAVSFTGTNATTSQSLNFTQNASIRSVFSVFRGAGFLLTSTVSYDFHRPDDTNPASPIWAPVPNNWTSPNVTGGQTYINGTQVDGSSFAMPVSNHNGFNQITLVTTGAVRADGFNRDRIYHAGNQTQAEVILYDTTLPEVQRLGTERYLRTKWFGEAPMSNILPPATALFLENTAILDLNGATQSVASLAVAPDAVLNLSGGHLTITGSTGNALVQGSITGNGSITNSGTLRLAGDAEFNITGTFTNTGVLDIMTWNGTLPAGFVNNGVVLDRSTVKVDSFEKSGNAFIITLKGYLGHNYQLQRSESPDGTWENIGASRDGDDSTITLSDPEASDRPRRFYRVCLSP